MRTQLLLLGLLLSSPGLVAQSTESVAPPSDNPQVGQISESATPVTDKGKPVTGGKLIHKVQPKYPHAAREAHIQGTVVLWVTIAKNGRVRKLSAISGPELLIPSAMKAVKQWRYNPFLQDNTPVEVNTDIRVNFQLSQ